MQNENRRDFLEKGLAIVTVASISGIGFLTGCETDNKEHKEADKAEEKEEKNEKEVSPPEDLMQEHGVLKRILLIYDTCRNHLINKEKFPIEAITNSAGIIRTFIEDYHEMQEEKYIFPRFRKANQLTDLVQILLEQHIAGREVTDEILVLSKKASRSEKENHRLTELLSKFNIMYSPHEAREDTVLFPAFRKIVSKHEYDSLGEEFEKNEHKMFGEDGFTLIVNKVAEIEKTLNIYDLAQFTPKL